MDNTSQANPVDCADFHLAEYARLGREINQRLGESSKYESTAGIALGAYLGWYLTKSVELNLTGLSDWAIALAPILFFLAALVRSAYSYIKVLQTATYLKEIEAVYADPRLYGWEHNRSGPEILDEVVGDPYGFPLLKNVPFLLSQFLIWGAILLLAIAPLVVRLMAPFGK